MSTTTSPANHTAQRTIANYFTKPAAESTPGTNSQSSTSKAIESNVSKLTPVNKTLFRDSEKKSATKAKRPPKSKLPPSSTGLPPCFTSKSGSEKALTVSKEDTSTPLAPSNADDVAPAEVIIIDSDSISECPALLKEQGTTVEAIADTATTSDTTDKAIADTATTSDTTDKAPQASDAEKKPKRAPKPRAPRAKKASSSRSNSTPKVVAAVDDLVSVDGKSEASGENLTASDRQDSSSPSGPPALESTQTAMEGGLPPPATVSMESETGKAEPDLVQPAPRKRKRTPKAKEMDDAEKKEEEEGKGEETPLPADIVLRLDMLRAREQGVLDSLQESQRVAMEQAAVSKGRSLESLYSLLTADTEQTSSQQPALEQGLKLFMSCAVQDSPQSLSALVSSVCSDVKALGERAQAGRVTAGTVCSEPDRDLLQSESWTRLQDPMAVGEIIKTLAARVTYGFRSPQEAKLCSVFEDASTTALWRWESMTPPTEEAECPIARDTIKNLKVDFGRGGRAVKAVHKAMEELTKCARKPKPPSASASAADSSGTSLSSLSSEDEVRVSALEDRVTKALLELHKSTERKLALQKKLEAQQEAAEKKEQKKLEAAAEKAEKEAIRKKAQEEKEREKQEAAESAKKSTRVASEKDLKEKALREKQKNMLMSFLGKRAAPEDSKRAAGDKDDVVEVVEEGEVDALIAPTSQPTTATASASVPAASPPPCSSSSSSSLDEEEFLSQLLSGKSLASISEAYRKRYSMKTGGSSSVRKRHRRLQTLTVTVSGTPTSAFDLAGSSSYSELKEVTVDPRRKLFSFAEDYRPPYCGTFSKHSRVISGRRPFARDTVHLNYDYDSEAEWEEEDPDGEDIAMSDNEDEEEGNDILYDDFFCRDDEVDFAAGVDGADGDSAVLAMRKKSGGLHYKSSIAGPCFLHSRSEATGSDAELLKRYLAVVHQSSSSPGDLSSPALRVGTPSHLKSMQTAEVGAVAESADATPSEPPGESVREARSFKESMLPDLAKFVHGRKEGVAKLVEGFVELLQQSSTSGGAVPSKLQIKKRIMDIADRKRALDASMSPVDSTSDAPPAQSFYGTARWIVKPETAEQLALQMDAPDYTPAKKKVRRIAPVAVASPAPPSSDTLPPTPASTPAGPSLSPTAQSPASSSAAKDASGSSEPNSSQQQASLLQFFPQHQSPAKTSRPCRDDPNSPMFMGMWEECKQPTSSEQEGVGGRGSDQ